MPVELFTNEAQTALTAAITSTTATSLTVTSSSGFPTPTGYQRFRVRIDNEILLVSAVSGTTWTVTRGVENTTPAVHDAGAVVTHLVTADALGNGGTYLAVKTADQAFTSTAYADVTDLSFRVVAGQVYTFAFSILHYASATTVGQMFSVNGPAAPTFLLYAGFVHTSATAITTLSGNAYDTATTTPTSQGSATSTRPTLALLHGTIIPSTSGTVILRNKAEAATVYVKQGSFVTVK